MFMLQNTIISHAEKVASQKRFENRENAELLHSIARAKLELELANQNFAYATDPLLVDVYTYQIKAAQAKYSYLLQRARVNGLTKSDYIKKSYADSAEHG